MIIMVARVRLVNKESFYSVLTFTDSSKENPKLITEYPYNSENQQIQLKRARAFGKEIAESLGISLEETIENQ
jgi:hypothetical protein